MSFTESFFLNPFQNFDEQIFVFVYIALSASFSDWFLHEKQQFSLSSSLTVV